MSICTVKTRCPDFRRLLRGVHKLVIGMVHLKPLLGSPFFEGSLEEVRKRAMRDAMALVGRAFERGDRGGEVDVELVRAFMAAARG